MGDLIQFRPRKVPEPIEMMPDDWATPYEPTLAELRITINTVRKLYYKHCEALDYCGLSFELQLRKDIKKIQCLHARLMNYYSTS
jgi:hypothetical protein